MCTALLPPGGNPIAVNKYIISNHSPSTVSYKASDGFSVPDLLRTETGQRTQTTYMTITFQASY